MQRQQKTNNMGNFNMRMETFYVIGHIIVRIRNVITQNLDERKNIYDENTFYNCVTENTDFLELSMFNNRVVEFMRCICSLVVLENVSRASAKELKRHVLRIKAVTVRSFITMSSRVSGEKPASESVSEE